MASYCPTCRGLMRPRGGVLECIRCSHDGHARTVVAKGRTIRLGQGQAALTDRRAESAAAQGIEAPLTPRQASWRPGQSTGRPHPQLGLFPHERIRDGQRRLARDATRAMAARKHLVAEAPTGIGKTAAVLAPALRHAIDHGKTVMFLTSRQSQHRIAVDTLRRIQELRGARFTVVDLVSKRDMCLRHEAAEMHPGRFPDFCSRETRTRSCKYLGDVGRDVLERVEAGVFHVEELMQASKDAGLCPHLVAMESAQHAQVVIADYNHLFSDIRDRSLERLGIALSDVVLVVDEAHNLPERIRKNHAHRVHTLLLDRVEEEARAEKAREVLADVAALRRTLGRLAREAEASGRAEEARLGEGKRHVVRLGIDDLLQAFEEERSGPLASTVRTIANVQEDLAPLVRKRRKGTDAVVHAETLLKALEDWGRFRQGGLRFLEWDDGEPVLHVRLLDPGVAARRVFDSVHNAVLMSGTLTPPEMARDLLGLEADRTMVRRYPSPFPPHNRLVCVGRGHTTAYKRRGEAMWQRMGRAITDLCESANGNIAVFAPSYAILGEVAPFVETDKERIQESSDMGKAERDQVLDQLRGAKGRRGALLLGVLGGSFSEGVDYKDQLLDAVVVLGLPLAPPDLEVEASIGYFERRFPGHGRRYGYIMPAMNKVLQAMGRGIRSDTDRCAILLLDERYLQPQYREVLPEVVASDDPAFTAFTFLEAHRL